jgi:hypothetical protein
MKYKVGDRVRIKSLDWYNENKDSLGNIDAAFFDEQRARFCGSIQTIASEGYTLGSGVTIYAIEGAYEFIGEESIEGLVEGGTKFGTASKNIEIKSNATKIVLEKKKKEYPKTYEECCKVLGVEGTWHVYSTEWEEYDKLTPYEKKLDYITSRLKQILVCRDAYWKIAGEEMGLGKPWVPDWTDDNAKYSIYTFKGALTKAISCYDGAIFTFPTAEMRDAFYENFKKEIEQCKKLL